MYIDDMFDDYDGFGWRLVFLFFLVLWLVLYAKSTLTGCLMFLFWKDIQKLILSST